MTRPSDDVLKKIALVVFDVDGVLTSGGLLYAEDGHSAHTFDVRDGLALARASRAGPLLAAISALSRTLPASEDLEEISERLDWLEAEREVDRVAVAFRVTTSSLISLLVIGLAQRNGPASRNACARMCAISRSNCCKAVKSPLDGRTKVPRSPAR